VYEPLDSMMPFRRAPLDDLDDATYRPGPEHDENELGWSPGPGSDEEDWPTY
jgi:hypothetical protein